METNPVLIMLINMTIVFGVLIALGVLMQLIHFVDPTKKKVAKVETVSPVATPAAPVANNNDEIIVAITGAIVSMGYSSDQIASIRPAVSNSWKMEGRLSGLR